MASPSLGCFSFPASSSVKRLAFASYLLTHSSIYMYTETHTHTHLSYSSTCFHLLPNLNSSNFCFFLAAVYINLYTTATLSLSLSLSLSLFLSLLERATVHFWVSWGEFQDNQNESLIGKWKPLWKFVSHKWQSDRDALRSASFNHCMQATILSRFSRHLEASWCLFFNKSLACKYFNHLLCSFVNIWQWHEKENGNFHIFSHPNQVSLNILWYVETLW